ncbi:unnamed protein product [Peronospora belbahrii]|uniref:HTH psq-type domain-containing protein n=1 Tax=Peronospora belbahrii TaxID=622444 RepID=A0AAU9LC94_9STRA|nr:unnamed protein product [Peronospora belbahrii]
MAVTLSNYVRRYLSESGEKEALDVLREQLRHHKRVTSDDVRLAVRAVASQGGTVAIPPDFPPSRWVFEFKRMHGFVQLNSFAFDTSAASSIIGGKTAYGTSKRVEIAPLRSEPATIEPGSKSERCTSASNDNKSNRINIYDKSSNCTSTTVAQGNGSSGNTSSDDGKEKGLSDDNNRSLLPMLSKAAVACSGPYLPLQNETHCQAQLQHSFSQRHRQQLQQQQRRAMIVDEHRRAGAWSKECTTGREEAHLGASHGTLSNETSKNIGLDTGSSGSSSDNGSYGGRDINAMLPQIQQVMISNSSSMDEVQDSASNASSFNDKRGYKLSHTVPVETWEKAIAAVEQQGMSLRTAAKMYGVHFAALHRRVKKRTQGGQGNGNDGYFHPNDEAGIMRVVVAHAELGVLMTFDELMRLVEAVALRKLPDISVISARKLLTRFESRNAQSIRHIIEDWPPPQPYMDAYSSAGETVSRQSQPYLEHPGFKFGPTSTNTGGTVTSAAVATSTLRPTSFVPPIRLAPNIVDFGNKSKSSAVRLIDTMRTMDIETTPSLSTPTHVGCVTHLETKRPHPSRGVCVEEGGDFRK